MTEFKGNVEIQDSTARDPLTTIAFDGDRGIVSVGGNGLNGNIVIYDADRKEKMRISADEVLTVQDSSGKRVFEFQIFDPIAALVLGTDKEEGGKKAGRMVLRDNKGNIFLNLDGENSMVEIKDQLGSSAVKLNGNNGGIAAHDIGLDGDFVVSYDNGKEMAKIGHRTKYKRRSPDDIEVTSKLGTTTEYGIWLTDEEGHEVIKIGPKGKVFAGGRDNNGYVAVKDSNDKLVLVIDGKNRSVSLVNSIKMDGKNHTIILQDKAGKDSLKLEGQNHTIILQDKAGKDSLKLEGQNHTIILQDKAGKDSLKFEGQNHNIILQDKAGKDSLKLEGNAGKMIMRDIAGNDSIILDGPRGDIMFKNADCAEDFDIVGLTEAQPGNVMVISEEGKLHKSGKAYDRRVAGVISGGGNYRPGLVLDKKDRHEIRGSISLMGKVYCKVEAESAPIEVGDMLTTSSIPGHAMKASDPLKAFGAVIGKALCSLTNGKGLIPILIALQ